MMCVFIKSYVFAFFVHFYNLLDTFSTYPKTLLLIPLFYEHFSSCDPTP